MNEKVANSIRLALSYLELDLSSVEIIDEEYGTWIAYITIDNTKALLIGQDEHHSTISLRALENLKNWLNKEKQQ